MKLIKECQTESSLPKWNVIGVRLNNVAEGHTFAQELVAFAADSLRKHNGEIVTRRPVDISGFHLYSAEHALTMQMTLAQRLSEVADPSAALDFVPGRLGKEATSDLDELFLTYLDAKGKGRVLAEVVETGSLAIEQPPVVYKPTAAA